MESGRFSSLALTCVTWAEDGQSATPPRRVLENANALESLSLRFFDLSDVELTTAFANSLSKESNRIRYLEIWYCWYRDPQQGGINPAAAVLAAGLAGSKSLRTIACTSFSDKDTAVTLQGLVGHPQLAKVDLSWSFGTKTMGTFRQVSSMQVMKISISSFAACGNGPSSRT